MQTTREGSGIAQLLASVESERPERQACRKTGTMSLTWPCGGRSQSVTCDAMQWRNPSSNARGTIDFRVAFAAANPPIPGPWCVVPSSHMTVRPNRSALAGTEKGWIGRLGIGACSLAHEDGRTAQGRTRTRTGRRSRTMAAWAHRQHGKEVCAVRPYLPGPNLERR